MKICRRMSLRELSEMRGLGAASDVELVSFRDALCNEFEGTYTEDVPNGVWTALLDALLTERHYVMTDDTGTDHFMPKGAH